nr:hypothetical protein Iba_scaffold33320CG0010 [Ipomoea batatas]GMD28806.1 hypothetical protein Iba_scaffold1211103CG0010 [Ipomoea batatas]GMD44377.1 hypothetical protein Iba_scaffold125308CG0010 [Ipomoea batatas]GME02996.1 hypothetical protein Iba_scaffold264CG0010 [Ipomoea batatas]
MYSKTYRLVDYSSQLTGSPSASMDSDFRGERRCSRVEKAAPQHVRLSLNAGVEKSRAAKQKSRTAERADQRSGKV